MLPSGSIVWRYRYRLNGKREKLTLDKYPALTLKNARLKRDEAAQLIAMGESPAKKKQQEKVVGSEDATVTDFSDRFFKDIQSRDRKDITIPLFSTFLLSRYRPSNSFSLLAASARLGQCFGCIL